MYFVVTMDTLSSYFERKRSMSYCLGSLHLLLLYVAVLRASYFQDYNSSLTLFMWRLVHFV